MRQQLCFEKLNIETSLLYLEKEYDQGAYSINKQLEPKQASPFLNVGSERILLSTCLIKTDNNS